MYHVCLRVCICVCVCARVCFFLALPFSLLHTRPKQPFDPPHSVLPPPYGPAGSRVHGNTQSGPYCSAASQPGKDPTTGKVAKKERVLVGLKTSMEGRRDDSGEAEGGHTGNLINRGYCTPFR